MARILVNASQEEEYRVAVVDGLKLIDFDIEDQSKKSKVNNVYIAVVRRVERSIEAAFVDYGVKRHGFLPLRNVGKHYLNANKELEVNTKLLVQVITDERGLKGASLSTFVKLQGNYTIMQLHTGNALNFAKSIDSVTVKKINTSIKQEITGDNHSYLIRSNADAHIGDLKNDIQFVKRICTYLETSLGTSTQPAFLLSDGIFITNIIQERMRDNITEVLIDNPKVCEDARDFVQRIMPEHTHKIKLYSETTPIFNRYQVERQLETAYNRNVSLPSGGELVFDMTEAMNTVDVNSAHAIQGNAVSQTALNTNLEAAFEIARQMRFRNISGLCVIDFIDMASEADREKVYTTLLSELRHDRAKISLTKISKLGLLELTRQRLKTSLNDTALKKCSICEGRGLVRSIRSLAIYILRVIEVEVQKENTAQIRAYINSDCASYILNEQRDKIQKISKNSGVSICVIPRSDLIHPQHKIIRKKASDFSDDEIQDFISYKSKEYLDANDITEDSLDSKEKPLINIEKLRPKSKKSGFWGRILLSLFGTKKKNKKSQNRKNNNFKKHNKPRDRAHKSRFPNRNNHTKNSRAKFVSANTTIPTTKQTGEKRRLPVNTAKPVIKQTAKHKDSFNTATDQKSQNNGNRKSTNKLDKKS